MLKAKFFPRLKALRCISASSLGPSKKSLTFLYKAFLRPLLTYASPGWFPFLSATNFTKLERLHRSASRAITGCLSSSPIALLLSEASLPPLRVTLTHCTLLSYERALRLPTSFPISGLAILGVKPILCKSSWRAFASTHPLMHPSTCSREALLACLPSPLWNLLSFTVESILFSPCSRSDPSLTHQGGALAHLDSLPLMIWHSGQTALFLFLLAKAAPAFLPTALSVSLRPLFPFRQAQYVQVFLLKPAPFFTFFAGLGSTNKSAISFLFSYCLTLVLFSPPCYLLHLSSYLKLCGRSGRNCLLFHPVLSGYNGCPDTRFSRETTRLINWLDRERYLRPLQPLVVCLLSLVSTFVFSRTEGVLSHRNSLTHRFPQFPPKNLIVLPRHARCVLSRLRCNRHSLLLGSYLSKIGRIENLSCSACRHSLQDTSHLILHLPAMDSLRRSLFGNFLSLYDLWSRPWGVAWLLGPMALRHTHIPRKGWGNQQQQPTGDASATTCILQSFLKYTKVSARKISDFNLECRLLLVTPNKFNML